MNFFSVKFFRFFKKKPDFLIYIDSQKIYFSQIKNNLGQEVYQLEQLKCISFENFLTSNDEDLIIEQIRKFFEKEKIRLNLSIKRVIFIFSPIFTKKINKLVPAVSFEELEDNLIFEIEEETGISARSFYFTYLISEKIVEKSIQKIKAEIFLIPLRLLEKIKQIFEKEEIDTDFCTNLIHSNFSMNFLKMKELLFFRTFKNDFAKDYENTLSRDNIKKMSFIFLLIFSLFLILKQLKPAEKEATNKKIQNLENLKFPEENLKAEVTSEIFRLSSQGSTSEVLEHKNEVKEITNFSLNEKLIKESYNSSDPVFTYQNINFSQDFFLKLVGTVTGEQKTALIQENNRIFAVNQGEKINSYILKEVYNDRIILSKKNNPSREIFLGQKIN